MTDEERTGTCVVCQQRDPLPDLEPVCGPCRSRVAGRLRDIPVLVDELRDPPAAEPFDRDVVPYPPGHERAGQLVPHLDLTVDGQERIEIHADHLLEVLDQHHGEQLAAVVRVEHLHPVGMPSASTPGRSNAPRVHGSREAPVPISVDRTDLLSDARVPNLTRSYERRLRTGEERAAHRRQQLDDQVGNLSAATVLDGWCRDWAETRRESVPEPIPAAQCRYLGDRLEWAFKQHDAVDEMAKEIGDLWHTLRRAAGLTEPRDELVQGIPCRSVACDLKTLWRLPGSEWVECATCHALLTEAELQEWIKMLRAPLCGKRNGEWWCSLAKKHDGLCKPYEGESAA